MTTDSRGLCRTCGNDWGWHQTNEVRHPFVSENSDEPDGLGPHKQKKGESEIPKSKTRVQVRDQPVDLGLRIALINKGILTPAEIAEADDQLREAIESGHVIFVGGPDRTQRDAARPDGDSQPSQRNAVLGPGGSSSRGLRSTDWPRDLEGSFGGAEAEEHFKQPQGQLEDRYGLGDVPSVPGYYQGRVLRPGDGVAQPSVRHDRPVEDGPGDDEDRRSLRRRNRSKRRGGEV